MTILLVMHGLDPRIHPAPQVGMDHRVRPGGDEAMDSVSLYANPYSARALPE
jgi:hypothetical protein